ncbi:questin oxidase family protein [Streptomyces tsukubensis]|uniref:DUF4243 domain-containing protein n=1 Tax=Streptomyces tsukubensis TaxID=83656 RepID=A0A1V4A5A7_9ACTN|nr:questin oxidase family protein [Streptomyces tsukubensis]OON76006.1 hypothetical protein B1H18_22040 [Streptomyces tsukubensis]QFR94098.1 DUF4243 domain-containing protein [Streptomyces tsukubensis]
MAEDAGPSVVRREDDGALDEALQRLHALGPEYRGRLSNHGPMVVEALVRGGDSASVHRWLDHYRCKLEDLPTAGDPVTDANWREALGRTGRFTDWTRYFEQRAAEHPWRSVLAEWWPRLLPGIAEGSTHPVIRTGHAVRTLLSDEATGAGAPTAPRLTELAHALGYWAARSRPLPRIASFPAPRSAASALAAVPLVREQEGSLPERFAQITALPSWPAPGTPPSLTHRASAGDPGVDRGSDTDTSGLNGPGLDTSGLNGPRPNSPGLNGSALNGSDAEALLKELVEAAVHRYLTHGHGEPVMLVHSATAPNAVLRVLPALPRELWPASLAAAWTASAAVTAAYTLSVAEARPAARVLERAGAPAPEEISARAAAHGNDHAIKFADTALDVGGPLARAAALRAVELAEPFF